MHKEVLYGHKKNEILSFATIWMEMEIILLSEISEAKKDNYHIISFIGVI
jgi:hypothetical protein